MRDFALAGSGRAVRDSRGKGSPADVHGSVGNPLEGRLSHTRAALPVHTSV